MSFAYYFTSMLNICLWERPLIQDIEEPDDEAVQVDLVNLRNQLITYVARASLLLVASNFFGLNSQSLFVFKIFLLDEEALERPSARSRELILIIATVVIACAWRRRALAR